MVSVVIPLYNKETTICRCIDSILQQTYADFEIIVVNDGSTDDSLSKLKTINDPRIKVINAIRNGRSTARNTGISVAKGDYIALLDADDHWDNHFLEEMIFLTVKYPQATVFASGYRFCDRDNRRINAIIRGLNFKDDGIISDYFKISSYSNPPIYSSNIMVLRGVLSKNDMFPENVERGEDLILWAKIACKNTIAFTKKILSTYNIANYPVGSSNVIIPSMEDKVCKVLDDLYSEYRLKSILLYAAQVKKMLVATLTRCRLNQRAITEASKGLSYNPTKLKLYLYIIINVLHISLKLLDWIIKINLTYNLNKSFISDH